MIHVLGLPHTRINQDYNQCAYTSKIRKFMQMFPEATLYANQGSITPHVTIFSNQDLERHFGSLDWYKKKEWYKVDYNYSLPYWKEFNGRIIEELKQRLKPHDIICSFAGLAQKDVADAFPNLFVEAGVGYEGVFSDYRVYESEAWRHYLYGKFGVENGRFFDTVIPNYFDISDFEFSDKKDDYLLFLSRPIERKGIEIVKELGKRGHRIIAAGREELKGENIEWVGYADTKKRKELLRHAKALLCPTLYIGPFEGVTVEAMLSGTPVITTPWGVFSETVEQGVNGYKCHTLGEFIEATDKVTHLDYQWIQTKAIGMYGLQAVRPKYQRYFDRLQTLHGKGWYSVLTDVV